MKLPFSRTNFALQNSLITICAATEWQKGDSNHESEEKNDDFFDEPSSHSVWLDACTNIYILDEPTTGLHAADIEKVVGILESFVDRGNTVIVIEHNTDVMKLADYIIDIGPDGGTKGGEVVFTGTPREMIEHGTSITAKYLRK